MVLSCPRCGTDVPSDALYCPYCSLQRPKRALVEEAEAAAAAAAPAPAEQPQAPKSTVYSQKLSRASTPRPSAATQRPTKTTTSSPTKFQPKKRSVQTPAQAARKHRLAMISLAVLIALLGVGIYIFVVPMVYSEKAEPKVILSALDKLRHLPSSDPSLTVDARLAKVLETSKRVGNLVSYQGWTVKTIKGTKHKVVLSYTFQEVGNVQQSAEWLVDLNNNTFIPQTELAKTVSSLETTK